MLGMSKENVWKAAVVGLAAVAGVAMRHAIKGTWKAARGSEPPENPAAPDVDWREAVAWSVASGVAVGLARLLARRSAAAWWEEREGHRPQEL